MVKVRMMVLHICRKDTETSAGRKGYCARKLECLKLLKVVGSYDEEDSVVDFNDILQLS